VRVVVLQVLLAVLVAHQSVVQVVVVLAMVRQHQQTRHQVEVAEAQAGLPLAQAGPASCM
jgi:hypothetical protein